MAGLRWIRYALAASCLSVTGVECESRRCTDISQGSWIAGGKFRYYISPRQEFFDSAAIICRSMDSQVVSIACEDELNFLTDSISVLALRSRSFVDTNYWIGLRRMKNGSLWWTDGSPVTYLNWDFGEPNDFNVEACVSLVTHQANNPYAWSDVLCNMHKRGYICKATATTTVAKEEFSWFTSIRQGSWISGGFFRYYIVPGRETFDRAEELCRNMDSQLVSIACEEELRFLTDAVRALGLWNTSVAKSYYWLGMRKAIDNTFRWTDGTPVTYLNWFEGRPNYNRHEACVEMIHSMTFPYKWYDSACHKKNGYICQAPASTNVTEGSSDICRTAVTTSANQRLTTTEGRNGDSEFRNCSINEESSSHLSYKETALTGICIAGGVIIAALVIAGIAYGFCRRRQDRDSARQASSDYAALNLRPAGSVAGGRSEIDQHVYQCLAKV